MVGLMLLDLLALFDAQRARQEPKDIICLNIFDSLSVTQEQAEHIYTLKVSQTQRFGLTTDFDAL